MLAILAASGFVFWQAGLGFHACRVDDDISLGDRTAVAQASVEFIELVRAGETSAVFERMSRAGLESTERAALLNIVEMTISAPGGELETRRTYSLHSIGAARGYAPCREDGGMAFVARGGGFHTMFAVVAEPIDGAERSWSFWFERERGVWRVRGVHVGVSEVAGRDGAELWALAEEQRRQNQVFNSTLLYDIASTALFRGQFLHPAEAEGFARARQMWRRHQDVIQARFHVGGQVFPIANMSAVGTGDGSLVLVLDQALDLPVTAAEADEKNRALIDGMNADRPEWRAVFDAIAVGSPTGPNRVWRTVYDGAQGYLPPPDEIIRL
ncbi:MAG TPA: hypothetical protein VEA80_17705 [Vitreimonas sp.]|uniref:hypothetical protein n=1 Tax=Vitreimonas sp. TaxID=3069702 RepID=UPI002D6D3D12|nr:hypothetical protein [Vitreimonas sp.]HYD89319.1 hypothetical protein [Vitreimonas sp.]